MPLFAPSADPTALYTLAGQVYTVAAKLSIGSAVTGGIAVYNPSTAKTAIIYSATYASAGGVLTTDLRLLTVDPALGTSAPPVNVKGGGAASLMTGESALTGLTVAGSVIAGGGIATNVAAGELLTEGRRIVLPAGSANAVALYGLTSAALTAWLSLSWVEV